MPRPTSMMVLEMGGQKTILVATSLSFRPARGSGARAQDHVGRPTDRDEPPGRVGDGGLAERDALAAAEDPPLGEDVALARAGEKAHVEIERRLPDAPRRRLVQGAEGAAHRGVHQRAVYAAVQGRP